MRTHNIDSKKTALFTDIHYGAMDADKEKGLVHNMDNDAFIDHFVESVKADPEIDSICMLGDWNQHRTAINLHTLKYAYEGMKKLDELGMPIYIILGNHDLYKKNDRTIHSLCFFEQFDNVVLFEDPTVMKQKNKKFKDVLMCPFLMHGEETELMQFLKVPLWFGHFEFNGYDVTGYGMQMTGGIDPKLFSQPDLILSGHFHKRQRAAKGKNICYIGNPFPTNYGDVGDEDRGFCTYDFRTNELEFFEWEGAPKYIKTTLSDILDGEVTIDERSYVKCIVDQKITYEESAALQKDLKELYNPRTFSLEESAELLELITDTESSKDYTNDDMATVDDMVVEMLTDVESESLDNEVLVAIYKGLQ